MFSRWRAPACLLLLLCITATASSGGTVRSSSVTSGSAILRSSVSGSTSRSVTRSTSGSSSRTMTGSSTVTRSSNSGGSPGAGSVTRSPSSSGSPGAGTTKQQQQQSAAGAKHPKYGRPVRTTKTMSGGGPQPSVLRVVQTYAIPNGQAKKTTQIITGKGISGYTETMQITQATSRRFSSKASSQFGKAPAVTTVTGAGSGTKVKLALGEGKPRLELSALPPIDFDVKSLAMGFFGEASKPGRGGDEDLLKINAKIAHVQKKVDGVFKTGFFAAESEYFNKVGDISTSFEQTSKKFKELGLKYPEFKLEF